MENPSCLDPTRESRLSAAASGTFDVVVIGGGIIGAATARDAALRGYSVLLLEAHDYAFGTSSRSSKLLHGGLRYLEQGDLALVRESLLERDIVLRSAPHLCRPQRCLFPVIPRLTRPAWQVRIGLSLYGLLARAGNESAFAPFERLSGTSEEARGLRDLGLSCEALFAYTDGQMEDTRLVIENILDATELGAITLNYARATSIRRLRGGYLPAPRRVESSPQWEIGWEDRVSGATVSSRARFLVLACGPWSKALYARAPFSASPPLVRFSRGAHMLFDRQLDLPALTLPTGESGRIYFVLPHLSPYGRATLVGTTDAAVENPGDNPQMNEREREELLGFLRRDLPAAALDEGSLFRSFCGVRVLVPSADEIDGRTSAVSRRERLLEEDGCISFWGGKYTTFRRSAELLGERIDRYFGRRSDEATRERPLPGGRGFSPAWAENFRHRLRQSCTTEGTEHEALLRERIDGALFRFGSRAEQLLFYGALKIGSNSGYFESEARLAAATEQVVYEEDLWQRRLLLWSMPG